MDELDIKPVLEGLLFISESPIRLETLAEILHESTREDILGGIQRIQAEYKDPGRGVELVEIAGGYQFRTKPEWAEWISRLKKKKPTKLSQSALETLAIIAYRQPVIRPEIDDIRGVDSGWILRSLLEKSLIKMMGRKDLPGRPIIYGTTKTFLELFSLNALGDLPSLSEVQPPIEAASPGTGEVEAIVGAVSSETDEGEPSVEAVSPEVNEAHPFIEAVSSGADEVQTSVGAAVPETDEIPPHPIPLPALDQNGPGPEGERGGKGE